MDTSQHFIRVLLIPSFLVLKTCWICHHHMPSTRDFSFSHFKLLASATHPTPSELRALEVTLVCSSGDGVAVGDGSKSGKQKGGAQQSHGRKILAGKNMKEYIFRHHITSHRVHDYTLILLVVAALLWLLVLS